ncbi:MAG: hypothetical protein Ct9H300mP1_20960 [Planctomycetaceae bacterium]|nr:MAG: hypothetical protein Ct9H300mP1_20960 [Planctomycetaceae bacterium]
MGFDPTSAAMNLVLLGMRGFAVNLLWMDYIKQQETKNWAQVRSTTESITMLQPHYLQIWDTTAGTWPTTSPPNGTSP